MLSEYTLFIKYTTSTDHEPKNGPSGSGASKRRAVGDPGAEGATTRAAGQDFTCPGKGHQGYLLPLLIYPTFQ